MLLLHITKMFLQIFNRQLELIYLFQSMLEPQ